MAFRSRLADLDQLDWEAIASTDFRDPRVKEHKQAELLVRDRVLAASVSSHFQTLIDVGLLSLLPMD
ncbi:MAG: DUF4433 domain-containing protein [Candidatus Schekmanbacteria bacterium]|nr:DUF4433 domain-containing protein [Candidatus Schekmanbacteria bacterium]